MHRIKILKIRDIPEILEMETEFLEGVKIELDRMSFLVFEELHKRRVDDLNSFVKGMIHEHPES